MKFKVGQKVRNKNSVALDGGELLKIVKLDTYDKTCLCESTKGTYWQYECNLEPFVPFQEKLDRFMKEPVGFLVKSKEIADELAKVFERKHMKPHGSKNVEEFMTVVFNTAKGFPGDAYVCYNAEGYEGNLMCGTSDFTSEYGRELLDVTLDELKEYLEPTEDFNSSEQEEYMKLQLKLMDTTRQPQSATVSPLNLSVIPRMNSSCLRAYTWQSSGYLRGLRSLRKARVSMWVTLWK